MFYRILIILIIVALTVVYSFYQKSSLQSQLTQSKSEAVLAKLPSANFEMLDGKEFEVDELYKETKPSLVIVHFWGTWCAPCEAELPDFLSLMKRFEGRDDVKFLLVAVNDEIHKVEKHIRGLAIPKASIHWLLDNKNIHRDAYGTTRVPETFVFSSDKATLRKFVGPQEWNKTMFFQTFDELLQISSRNL